MSDIDDINPTLRPWQIEIRFGWKTDYFFHGEPTIYIHKSTPKNPWIWVYKHYKLGL